MYFCLLSPPRRTARAKLSALLTWLLKLPRLNQVMATLADATFFDACFSCIRVNHQIADTLCDVAAEKSMHSELVLWFKLLFNDIGQISLRCQASCCPNSYEFFVAAPIGFANLAFSDVAYFRWGPHIQTCFPVFF